MVADFKTASAHWSRPRHILSHASVTNALRILWLVLVIAGELGVFFWSLSDCRWPTVNRGHTQFPKTNILLLADTHVPHSFSATESWTQRLRSTLLELNLRKSWHVTARLKPDVVIFLGDMLANGRFAKTYEEYEQAVQKFKSIFHSDSEHGVPFYFIPGNNDVGLGLQPTASRKLKSYYHELFGPSNQEIKIANHTLILLDAPALVDEDYQRHAKYVTFEDWKPLTGGPVAFVKDVAEYDPDRVILFSHIPLSRPDGKSCGPLRERAGIRRNAGPGYQSMLGKQTTNFLLRNLQPIMVYSADNRDYCEYYHILPGSKADASEDESIREVTLKSFSPSIHINRPGFQLLTLVDGNQIDPSLGQSSLSDRLCLLPDQSAVYTSLYLPCMLVTLVLLFIINVRAFRRLGTLFGGRPKGRMGGSGVGIGRKKPKVDRDRLGVSTSPSRSSSGRNSPNNLVEPSTPWSPAPWSPFSPTAPSGSGIGGTGRSALPSHLRTPRTPSGSAARFAVASSSSGAGGGLGSGPGSPTLAMASIYNSGSGSGMGLVDDQEDHLYPHQYAQAMSRRESYAQRDDDDWTDVRGRDGRLGREGDSDDDEGDESGYSEREREGDLLMEEGTQVIEMKDHHDANGPSAHSPRPKFISAPGSGWKENRSSPWSFSYTFTLMGRRRRISLGVPTWRSFYNLLDLVGFGEGSDGKGRGGGLLLSAPPRRARRRGGAVAVLLDLLGVLWPGFVVYIIINWRTLT